MTTLEMPPSAADLAARVRATPRLDLQAPPKVGRLVDQFGRASTPPSASPGS